MKCTTRGTNPVLQLCEKYVVLQLPSGEGRHLVLPAAAPTAE